MQPLPDWRPHALDGALLWFHRKTGTNLRVDGPPTRHLRRRAPRLVLFGITNACNLTCSFCSRDREARSEWTVESAFEVLSGLARAGTLEVAFGGGEPLAFRGFDELVRRLATETSLAVHFTTNGTLLSEERLARLSPFVGEIRVSLYDDNAWEACIQRLGRSGQTFGANLLVTPDRLVQLSDQLRRLDELGCRDAALLRYVGNDPRLRLSVEDEARLTTVLAESPLRARLSVCFGDMLMEVPRLFGGDCGAGLDFVTLTSDRRLKACSFQSGGLPVASADEVLAAWSQRQEVLSAPSPLQGCARAASPRTEALAEGVRIWRGFSGNNSGDCVMVGRFETSEEASAYIDALLPDWQSGKPYPERWKELLTAEGIQPQDTEYAPEAMASIGRTVMLHTDTALADDFPSLRALLWKRKGRVVSSVIHGHDPLMLATGLGPAAGASLGKLEQALGDAQLGDFTRHANQLYGLVPIRGLSDTSLPARVEKLKAIARESDASLSAEMVQMPDEPRLERHFSSRGPHAGQLRLWARFDSEQAAAHYARDLDGGVTVAGRHVLLEEDHFGPRLGFLAHRQGGSALLLTSARVIVSAGFTQKDPGAPDLVPYLRPALKPDDRLDLHREGAWASLRINTLEPGRVLKELAELERLLNLELWLYVQPDNPLAETLHRIRQDLRTDTSRR